MALSATMEMWATAGSKLASFLFFWAIISHCVPKSLRLYLEHYTPASFFARFNPYIKITINEYTGERLIRNKAFCAAHAYLSKKSWKSAKRLKAESVKDNAKLVLSMDENEMIYDVYKGVKVWWVCTKLESENGGSQSSYLNEPNKRAYRLTFHQKYKDLVIEDYLEYVMDAGKEIMMSNRQRKLYSNYQSMWSHIVFEHPATFETVAMEADKKIDLIEDLLSFSQSKEFYKTIGKAWKRGYLLYGPPGTGKSSTIAAMENFLNYDVYDLELTSVLNNDDLKRLLIQITSKSIIVIEDIDCASKLTGQRRHDNNYVEYENNFDGIYGGENNIKCEIFDKEDCGSRVTLSGLLNFIDGLWSAAGGERIIVFTTNFVQKLDPALIRRGRMDKHIELSYCSFDGFKVLAKNYVRIENHETFSQIEALLNKAKITPADVAENLMRASPGEDPGCRLMKLIQVLEAKQADMVNKKKMKVQDDVDHGSLIGGRFTSTAE